METKKHNCTTCIHASISCTFCEVYGISIYKELREHENCDAWKGYAKTSTLKK